jgi:hypothetical protein
MHDDVSAVVLDVVYTSPTKSPRSKNSEKACPRLDFSPKLDWPISSHLPLAEPYSPSRPWLESGPNTHHAVISVLVGLYLLLLLYP